MCSSSPDKPKLPAQTPIIPDTPPEETEVSLGQEKEAAKKKKKRKSKGSRQLAIPMSKGSSGLGIPNS